MKEYRKRTTPAVLAMKEQDRRRNQERTSLGVRQELRYQLDEKDKEIGQLKAETKSLHAKDKRKEKTIAELQEKVKKGAKDVKIIANMYYAL